MADLCWACLSNTQVTPAPSPQPLIPSSVPPLSGRCASLVLCIASPSDTSGAILGHSLSIGQNTRVKQQPIYKSFLTMVLPACSWPGARQQHPPSPWTGWRMWWWTRSFQWSQQRQSWCSLVSTGWHGHTAQQLAEVAQHGGQQQSWQPPMALSAGWHGPTAQKLARGAQLGGQQQPWQPPLTLSARRSADSAIHMLCPPASPQQTPWC